MQGGEGKLSVPAKGKSLYLGNAGTAARFLTTVCTVVSVGSSDSTGTTITGNARMKQRPIGPLAEALSANGAQIKYLEDSGCLPLEIAPNGLRGGHIKLAASVSSQYVSSILLCAPYAAQQVTLELTGGQVISQPYIDMTIAMMAEFGIRVERQKDSSGKLLDVYVIPKDVYTNPEVYNVESDASSATYPLAIAAITGTTCTISNIGSSSLQGDARFAKEVLEPMGCAVEQTATSTKVTGPPIGQLRALGSVDMELMTDAFLTASVLAAVATLRPLPGREAKELEPEGARIYGIANQRVKECNRIKAMRDELGSSCLPVFNPAKMWQPNLESRPTSSTTASSSPANLMTRSSAVLPFTATTITESQWPSAFWPVSSIKRSLRRSDVLRRPGRTTGMIYRIR